MAVVISDVWWKQDCEERWVWQTSGGNSTKSSDFPREIINRFLIYGPQAQSKLGHFSDWGPLDNQNRQNRNLTE